MRFNPAKRENDTGYIGLWLINNAGKPLSWGCAAAAEKFHELIVNNAFEREPRFTFFIVGVGKTFSGGLLFTNVCQQNLKRAGRDAGRVDGSAYTGQRNPPCCVDLPAGGGGGIRSIDGGECVMEPELLYLAAAPFPDSAL